MLGDPGRINDLRIEAYREIERLERELSGARSALARYGNRRTADNYRRQVQRRDAELARLRQAAKDRKVEHRTELAALRLQLQHAQRELAKRKA